MRDKSEEQALLARFDASLEEYPAAGIIAGIVAVESDGKVLMTDVGTLGLTGYHLTVLGCILLERASEELRAIGSVHLVAKIEKALAALDIETVDVRVKH